MDTQLDINEIKLADKCRDFSWIKEKYDKGELVLAGVPFSKKTFEKFRAAVKLVNDVYENLWDIDINAASSTCNTVNIEGIVIHFPKVYMTNSRGKKHFIEDLFIKIVLEIRSTDEIRIRRTLGGRTTLTYAEYSSYYLHSHLHSLSINTRNTSRKPPYFDTFCTGSGHINDYIAEINTDGYTDKVFTSYLVQLLSLASWESIEGTPYISISSIFERETNSARRSNIGERDKINYLQSLITHHKTHNIFPELEFTIENGAYTILENPQFDKFLSTLPLTDAQKKKYLCMKDVNGIYYEYGGVPGVRTPPELSTVPFIFKGKPIFARISNYETPKTEEENVDYFLHPSIKEYIKKEIEHDTNQKIIRKSTLDRYSN